MADDDIRAVESVRDRLGVLATLDGIEVLPLDADEAATVSSFVRPAGGDPVRAHAVWAALRYRAYFLTTEPDRAPSVLADWQVHPIPEDDA